MAEILCQMCGKPNPAGAQTCQYCQARIVPLAPSSPTEKPEPPGWAGGEGVPDWLTSLRGTPGQPTESEPPQDLENPAPEDWLSRIGLGAPASEPPAPAEPASPAPAAEPPIAGQPENSSQPPQPGSPFEGTPDWLESMRQAVSPAQKPPETASEPPSPEPDWLASFRQPAGGAEPPQKPAGALNENAADDWLTRLHLTEPEQPDAPTPAPESAPLPDWLAGAPAPDGAAGGSAWGVGDGDLQPESSEEELPDWMKILRTPPPAAAAGEDTPGLEKPGEESTEFVNFLKGASQAEGSPSPFDEAPAGAPQAAPETPDWSNLDEPDWLADLEARAGGESPLAGGEPQKPAPDETAAGPGPEELPPAPPFISSAMPDWLGELGYAESSQDKTPEADRGEDLPPAELPGWVQALRPVETVAPAPPPRETGAAENRVEESGPLAGLRGILPSEPVITPASKAPAFTTRLEISEQQQRHIELFQKLLDTEDKPATFPAQPAVSSQRMLRWGIAGVLILALLIPLLGGVRVFPTPDIAPQEVADVQSSLVALPENAPVLLVADYSPAVVGEIHAAGDAVVTDLLRKGARLAVISTSPTGPALANDLIQGLLPEAGNNSAAYASGTKIVRLGYLPGGASGLAAFIADPKSTIPFTIETLPAWEQPGLQGVRGFSDFARVVLMTDNADTGRAWIEQTQPKLGSGSEILLIAAAQAAPALRPYLDSHQARGMVAGIAGGAAYEMLDQRPGTGQTYWNAFQFGTWTAVLILIAGAAALSARPILDAIRGQHEDSA